MSDTATYEITKIIVKKRKGAQLTKEEIKKFINFVALSCMHGDGFREISGNYTQIGAMLMALYLRGLSAFETREMTKCMCESGHVLQWPEEWRHLVVDKHSTGGVGDKVSLLLAPALAACGLKVPMISGRSLQHTGGTLDKLESIPGYRTDLSNEEIKEAVGEVGCCIVGQTESCCPADKVLYAMREITGTVDSNSLITASIVSKKLSEGLSGLIYDVKFGRGSFFESFDDSLEMAKNLVEISQSANPSALLTSMEYPLGRAVGNGLEVIEAIHSMRPDQTDVPEDLIQVTVALGGEIIRKKRGISPEDGRRCVLESLQNGEALKIFWKMIVKQGVSEDVANDLCYGDCEQVLQKARYKTTAFYNGPGGYVAGIDPLVISKLCKDEFIASNSNDGVGVVLLKKVGQPIDRGEAWMEFHHDVEETLSEEQSEGIKSVIIVTEERPECKLIEKLITFENGSLKITDYEN